ncbi:transmembrane protein 225 isoform X4 [Peromyscus maniculatus bairdii]|uniref:transmembrane protein 225 isoform X4 n=1 Tax=Peromyscus maniculatus bairdii TaxID=230844 RepID=UPI003FD415F7
MMHLPNRSIQSVNIVFSSGAIVMLVVGLIMENWVELIPKIRKDKTTHSPWLGCCPAFWPEGLQFTSMISQNKCVHLLIGFLSFFTVTVYHHRLNKGQQKYFVTYKVKWIAFTVYLAIALFLTCGIFCFMQCTNKCACPKFCIPSSEVSSRRLSGSSIQVISLPERTTMPRSIVHVHSMTSNDGTLHKPHVQSRRVTWAV